MKNPITDNNIKLLPVFKEIRQLSTFLNSKSTKLYKALKSPNGKNLSKATKTIWIYYLLNELKYYNIKCSCYQDKRFKDLAFNPLGLLARHLYERRLPSFKWKLLPMKNKTIGAFYYADSECFISTLPDNLKKLIGLSHSNEKKILRMYQNKKTPQDIALFIQSL